MNNTHKFSDIAINDLSPLVKLYHRELAAGNVAQTQELRQNIAKVSEKMLPIGDEVAFMLQKIVKENKDLVDNKIVLSQEQSQFINYLGLFICLVALVIGIIASFVLSRMIRNPLFEMLNGANKYAAGDLRNKIEFVSDDELGGLAAALNTMQENLKVIVESIASSARQVAQAAAEMEANANNSTSATGQVADAIMQVADGSENQKKAISSVLTVMEEIATRMTQVAGGTDVLAQMSIKATQAVESGDKAVMAVKQQMISIEQFVDKSTKMVNELGLRSQEIGQIVNTISAIAGQTNLLALNAAIEAARAGEAGRGFAVVAEEVRILADQSQQAAKQISDLISHIQTSTQQTILAMNEGVNEVRLGTEVVLSAGQAFNQITEFVEQVSSQVDETAATVRQISSGSQQVVASVREIDSVSQNTAHQSQTVSSLSEELIATMEEITYSSHELAKMAEMLHNVVGKFKIS